MNTSVPFTANNGIYVHPFIKNNCYFYQNIYRSKFYFDCLNRQFVFTVLKLVRPYFKHDRKLFIDVSKLIHSIATDYYKECCGKEVITESIISHQTYDDMMRFNPHWHCIILEGGLDDNNDFYHVPLKNTIDLTEAFRKAVTNLFVEKKLLNKNFAEQVLT